MLTIYLLLTNIFLLTSPYIIRDLPFNTYYIEDMSQYENKLLSEGTEFFIRFPYNAENEIKFYLILSKNIAIFPIYISEFAENPDETDITNTNFINEKSLSDQEEEGSQYIKYSYDITITKPYQVIYFKNDKKLDYISFYAYSFADNTFSNIQMNKGFSIYSLKKEYSYYLKFDITDSDGKKLKITTSADINYEPKYVLDLKCFYYTPTEYEMTKVDYSWERSLHYKLGDNNDMEERNYEYELSKSNRCCVIRIYNQNVLDELHIYLEMTEKGKVPFWVWIIVSVVVLLIIIALSYCCKKSRENLDDPNNRQAAAACCLAGCLCAWCLASIATPKE